MAGDGSEFKQRQTLFKLNLGRIDVSKDVNLDDLVSDTEVCTVLCCVYLCAVQSRNLFTL